MAWHRAAPRPRLDRAAGAPAGHDHRGRRADGGERARLPLGGDAGHGPAERDGAGRRGALGDAAYRLSQAQGIDLFFSYWSGPWIAHLIVSATFADQPPLAFSIEIRREKGESYSPVAGFFKQYELAIVAADETDVIRLRTDVWREDVRLYRLNVAPAQARTLLEAYASEVAALNAEARWYHTILANCATVAFRIARQVWPGLRPDWRVVAAGRAPEVAYDIGAVATHLPFAELQAQAAVSARARAAAAARISPSPSARACRSRAEPGEPASVASRRPAIAASNHSVARLNPAFTPDSTGQASGGAGRHGDQRHAVIDRNLRTARRRRHRRLARRRYRRAAQEKLKIGFIYVGPVGDFGWSYQHDQGRKAIEAAFPGRVETSYIENVPEAGSDRVIEQLARTGHKLIFTTSFGYMEPTLRVAAKYPDVKFEHATGFKRAPNVATYSAKFHEGRYIAGQIAGRMTKSNIVGYVGAFPIPEVVAGINAFYLGAKSVNPNIEIRTVWANTWFDPPKEADAAKVLLDQGADVITQHTDSPAPLQAAAQRGRYAFGQASDMTRFGEKTILTSIIDDWSPYYVQRTRAVLEGKWASQDTFAGLAEGEVKMAPTPTCPRT